MRRVWALFISAVLATVAVLDGGASAASTEPAVRSPHPDHSTDPHLAHDHGAHDHDGHGHDAADHHGHDHHDHHGASSDDPVVGGLAPPGTFRSAAVPAPASVIVGVGTPSPATVLHDPVDTIAGGDTNPSGGGWYVTSTGAVRSYGGALHHGDLATIELNERIVAMAGTSDGGGYWLVAADGGVFAFGNARFWGSTGHLTLQRPIVDIAATADDRGYLLAADDGGVFAFGNAHFRGSMGSVPLNQPIVGLSLTGSDAGYWLVARDGGVFAFGDAPFLGSTGAAPPSASVVDIVPSEAQGGYRIVTERGDVHSFGTAGALPASGNDGTATVVAASDRDSGVWLTTQPATPLVYAWQSGGLTNDVIAGIFQAINNAGAYGSLTHNGTLGVHEFRRAGRVLHAAAPGWQYGFTARAVTAATAAPFHGSDVAEALRRGEVVMSAESADLRGARTGDTVVFAGWDGRLHERTIGAIVPGSRVGSSELVFSVADASSFGFQRGTSIWIGGVTDLGVLENGLADVAAQHTWVRWSRSWDARNPDSTLATVRLKQLLGEFQYRPTSNGFVEIDPSWVASNIVRTELPILGRWRCHRAILPDLVAALHQIQTQGLAELIDVRDSRFGGCWVAREIRGASGGALSRHAWGLAVDLNPSTNGFGAEPQMDLRIVEIFRAHGFAWGGTWTRPDGMHFEWIGGRT